MTPESYVRQIIPTGCTAGDVGTGEAPANLALVKYWGKRDTRLNLPVTSSLSISLGKLGTRTRLTPRPGGDDLVLLNDEPVAPESAFAGRLGAFLDLLAPSRPRLCIDTHNTIPTAAGLASSASGYAALVLALDDLYGWQLPRPLLSRLARLGSGSACRSLWPGFVLWQAGKREDGQDCQAEPLPEHWPDLRIGVLTLHHERKPISSREAMHRTVADSTLYQVWPEQVASDLREMREALAAKDFPRLGQIAETNALTMHATMLGCQPPVLYWQPETVATLHRIWELRRNGQQVFTTMDAGPNVKLLFLADSQESIRQAFPAMRLVSPFQDS